jgi:hypothetical protein
VRLRAPLALALQAALGAATVLARADSDGGVVAPTLTCEHVTDPGRVPCEVEARVEAGESIAWGDVVLLRTPVFTTALRGRIGPHDASVREPTLWRWRFALVARQRGSGDLSGRVRMVVCRGDSCAAREVEVAVKIEVGP